MSDYFTLLVTGCSNNTKKLEQEISDLKDYIFKDIKLGIKERRTTGDMLIKWHVRGKFEKEQRHAKFAYFDRRSHWIYIRLYRKDGTLGEHVHLFDPADIIAFDTIDTQGGGRK